MADLLQSSTSAATTTPTFYTDYLSNLASKGTAAGNAASSPSGLSAYDPNALQNQAYSNVAGNAGNYKPGLAAAGQTTANAAGTNIQGAVQPYINAAVQTGGLQLALPYLNSGMDQNTAAASANPYLKSGTSTNGLSQANPYLNSGMAQNTAAASANPYLKSGTSTNGLSQANPYLNSGMAQNTSAAAANPYLQAGTSTNGVSVAQGGVNSGLQQNTGAASANPYLKAGTATNGATVANPYLTSGTTGADQLVNNYMNPYTQQVVDRIAATNQQNIAQNLSPGITAGAVGGGQFGSQRGANALSLGISNANIGALGQQAQALQSGYAQSLDAAQKQRLNELTAGQTAGQLQSQYNSNQVNAGQIAGSLQAQQAQQAINAGLGLGQLQSQYNSNQVNAGQIASTAQNQQAQNALNAGATAGQLQNQFNTNQVNAGQIAGSLQNQQAQNALNAGQTVGNLRNTANSNMLTAGSLASNAANQQGQLGVAAGQQQANQANQLQQQGLADTNALGILGGQKQQMAQAKVMQPLDVLGKQAGIMSGAQLPTTTTQTSRGSPLSAIAGLGATAGGLFQQGSGGTPSIASNLGSAISTGYDKLFGNNRYFSSPSNASGSVLSNNINSGINSQAPADTSYLSNFGMNDMPAFDYNSNLGSI